MHCPKDGVLVQAVTVQKAAKRSAGRDKDSKPRRSKKRKVNEAAATVKADSGNQPEAAVEGQLSQDGPMQWGGKQKRKHARQAPCGLPDQARSAMQQRLLSPYFRSPPAVAHPSEGGSPAATPSAAGVPGPVCDAMG